MAKNNLEVVDLILSLQVSLSSFSFDMRRKKEKLVKLISADQKSPFDKKRKKEKLVELISADQKSPFDMRRKKAKLVELISADQKSPFLQTRNHHLI